MIKRCMAFGAKLSVTLLELIMVWFMYVVTLYRVSQLAFNYSIFISSWVIYNVFLI